MTGVAAYTSDFKPDFGIPWDREWDAKVQALPDVDVFALLEFKAFFEGQATITKEQLDQGLAKLSDAARLLAWKFIAEKNAQTDPIEWGWTLDSWREMMGEFQKYIIHCIFGGNRGTKSSLVARLVVWCALHIPEFRCRCYQVNEEKSISEQQAFIWEALPQRFKSMGKRKGTSHTVQYTQANGFTGGKLIIPPLPGYKRGAEILFGNYQQYKNDPQVVEGWWAHLIWCDEECPQKMFERLLTRLGDAKGRIILTFTTIQGWSPLVADIISKVKTLRTRTTNPRFEPLKGKQIPVAQESRMRNSCRIYYFATEDNPFIPPDWIFDLLKGRPAEEIKAVAYGIPTKSASTPFPKFDEEVHVLPAKLMPWLAPPRDDRPEPEFTRYHVIDPSGSKPWAMIWAAVGANGSIYVYKEWPDESYGPWAEPGNTAEGKKGPAQKPNGFGINDYQEQIAYAEGVDQIFERIIDPRLGAAVTQTNKGSVSIISELDDIGIVAIPAPGLQIEHGLQLINDALGYDTTAPISSINHPKLYISYACTNVIYALKEYTGKGGKDEAAKDFIDCLRYLLENGADFVSSVDTGARGSQGSY